MKTFKYFAKPLVDFSPLISSEKEFTIKSLEPKLLYLKSKGLYSDGAASFAAEDGSWLECASNPSLQTGDVDFTWAMWVYCTSVEEYSMFLSKGQTDSEYEFRRHVSQNKVSFVGHGGAIALTLENSLILNTWHFLIGWHDAQTNTLNIQVNNGSINSQNYIDPNVPNSDPLRLSKRGDGFPFSGCEDSIGFWKRVLTPTERTWLYNAGAGRSYSDLADSVASISAGLLDDNLVSWWDMDEVSGTRYDSHGDNHLSEQGRSIAIAPGIASGEASKLVRKAASFTTTTANLSCDLLIPPVVTLCGWYRSLVDLYGSGYGEIGWTHQFYVNTRENDASIAGRDSLKFIPYSLNQGGQSAQRWVFYALQYEAGILRFYADGVLIASEATSAPIQESGFHVGWHLGPGSYPQNKLADSVMVFGSANPDIIAWAHNSGRGRDPRDATPAQRAAWNAIAGWPLDEEWGTRYDVWGTHHLMEAGTVGQVEGKVVHAQSIGAPISLWQDQSGNNLHAVQTVFAKRPILAKGGVKFDGIDDFMSILNSTPLTDATSAHIYVTYEPEQGYYNILNTTNSDSWWDFTGEGYFGEFRSSRLEGYPPSMPGYPAYHSGLILVEVHSSQDSYEVVLNGVSQGVQPGSFSAGAHEWTLGSNRTGRNKFLKGTIQDILVATNLSESKKEKTRKFILKSTGII